MSTVNPTSANPTGSVAKNADGTRTAAESRQGLGTNYSQFLKLLTTQLTNQDPTAPLDTNQITQQIATLSQVEQGINTNSKLEQLIALFTTSQANDALSYIGRQIDAAGNKIALKDGKAAVVYTLPAGAASTTVTISDEADRVVYTGPGLTASGRNQMLWSGVNSVTNEREPDGAYKFTVEAKDASGAALTATTYTTGTVTAVETKDGVNKLSLGRVSVPLNTVQSVYTAGTNPGI